MYGSGKARKPKSGVKHIKTPTYFILISEEDKNVRYYDAVEMSILDILRGGKANELNEKEPLK